jgi:hypothetical protein
MSNTVFDLMSPAAEGRCCGTRCPAPLHDMLGERVSSAVQPARQTDAWVPGWQARAPGGGTATLITTHGCGRLWSTVPWELGL